MRFPCEHQGNDCRVSRDQYHPEQAAKPGPFAGNADAKFEPDKQETYCPQPAGLGVRRNAAGKDGLEVPLLAQ